MSRAASQASAKDPVPVTSGDDTHSAELAVAGSRTLEPSLLGVETPSIPGDISLAGELSVAAVAALAPRYKGWLYMNRPEDPAFHRETIEAAGCVCKVTPLLLKPPPTVDDAEAILVSMRTLPRPLMIQCSAGNRAGAALLLWLAKEEGCNATSAEQLAQDLDLKFFTRCDRCGPVQEWVLAQLPQPAGVAPPLATKEGPFLEQRFVDDGTSTFTYLLACPTTSEALLIDPVLGQEERDLAWVEERGLVLKYVLNTHAHADHITSGSAIRKLRPAVKTVIGAATGAAADVLVNDGDIVMFGSYALEVMATPGHTDGCVTYVLRVGGVPKAAFTGDALLIRGCGRTDFQQGSSERLYDSVTKRIFTLPGDTVVYPGHDYKGRNVSTVEEERRFNPRLSKSKDEFIQLMAALELPMPRLIDVAVPANMRDGEQA